MHESLIAAIIGISAAGLFLLTVRSLRRQKQASSPAQTSYFAGLSYYLAGDKEKALQRFLETVRKDTDYVDAYIKIGDILRGMGQTENAIKIHRDLLVRQQLTDEQKLAIYRALAEDYKANKNYPQAIDMVQKIFELEKNHPWARTFQIELYEEMGDWPQAIACIEENDQLTKEEKKKRKAFYLLEQGLSLAKEGKEHEARLRYREAIKENGALLAAYLELVDSYLRDGRPKAALTVLKKMTKMKWPFAELVFDRLKQVLFELGLFSDLEQFYAEIEPAYPESADVQMGLAEIYLKKGDLNRAEAACRAALATEPDRLDAKLLLADLCLKKSDLVCASESLSSALLQVGHKSRIYLCGSCGYRLHQYFYRCPNCKVWDSAQRG